MFKGVCSMEIQIKFRIHAFPANNQQHPDLQPSAAHMHFRDNHSPSYSF